MLKTGATIGVPLDLFTYVVDCNEKLEYLVNGTANTTLYAKWIAVE
jgi:hypothetical protein